MASLTWFETAFAGQPYGRAVRGTLESVARLEVPDMRGFVKSRLAKDNLTVGVAGDVTAEELGELLDLAFGDLPASSAPIELAATQPRGGTTRTGHAAPQLHIARLDEWRELSRCLDQAMGMNARDEVVERQRR